MISGGASTYIGYDSNDGVGFLEPNTITVLPDEPNELITRFVAQGLTYGMLQFGFTSMELWDRIAGYPGEPLGFNIEVVKS